MANRFYDNYRPSHDGQSVVFGGGMIPTSKHRDVASYDFYADNIRTMGDKGGEISKYTENPNNAPKNNNANPFGKDGGPRPTGGSSVPRKPKPSPKNPSGGMKLPLPEKVGQ